MLSRGYSQTQLTEGGLGIEERGWFILGHGVSKKWRYILSPSLPCWNLCPELNSENVEDSVSGHLLLTDSSTTGSGASAPKVFGSSAFR